VVGRVVVGVDGSPESVNALRAAAREAALRGGTLEVVGAWTYPAAAVLPVSAEMPGPADLVAHVHELLDKALADAGVTDGEVVRRVVQDKPGPALVEAAVGADLLVVGARGLGAFDRLLLGSVSDHCINHSSTPVLIVRETPSEGQERIVVGVDGSEGSRRALQWAVDEAKLRGDTRVEAVLVWQDPVAAAWPYPPVLWDRDSLASAAKEALDRVVAGVDVRGYDGVVEPVLAEGAPARVLLEAADGADLVVVGAHGPGGISDRLLGSVSRHVARHSTRPVVVVR